MTSLLSRPLTLWLLIAFFGLSAAVEARAQEIYDFDETCAPTTDHEIKVGVPDALIILDRSGSMKNPGGEDAGGTERSKLYIAQEAIVDLASATTKPGPCPSGEEPECDPVRLGLGWFSNSAKIDVEPGEDNADLIISEVNAYTPGGGTDVGEAAKAIHNSSILRNAPHLGLGVLITDGSPHVGHSRVKTRATVEETLHYLCRAREKYDVLTFVVGFGTGADPRMNSLFAAAGGTGTCCQNATVGDECTYQSGETFDPCVALERFSPTRLDTQDPYPITVGDRLNKLNAQVQCKGARQATTGQALKADLLELVNQAACTFPLTVPADYVRYPGADENPAATRVSFDHAVFGDDIRVEPLDPQDLSAFRDYLVTQRGVEESVADLYEGQGWFFADTQRRTVTFTSKLCEEVRSERVQITETQVACLCANTGRGCEVECLDADQDGYDDLNDAACDAVQCFDANGDGIDDRAGTVCVLNSCLDRNNDGKRDRDDTACPVASDEVQAGRCQLGVVECKIGEEVCASRFAAMPDLCNGLDDDCDGFIDNSSRANPARDPRDPADTSALESFEWNGDAAQLETSGLTSGVFCAYSDFTCGCDTSGPHEQLYPPLIGSPDPNHEWKRLLRSTGEQRNQCTCSAGLTAARDEPLIASRDEPFDPSASNLQESGAGSSGACAMAPTGRPSSPKALLWLVALGVTCAWRRRARIATLLERRPVSRRRLKH